MGANNPQEMNALSAEALSLENLDRRLRQLEAQARKCGTFDPCPILGDCKVYDPCKKLTKCGTYAGLTATIGTTSASSGQVNENDLG